MPTPIVHLFRSRGTAATPGYFIASTPFAGVKSTVGTWARAQSSGWLSGGLWYQNPAGQNNSTSEDHWLATGTYKISEIVFKDSQDGIATYKFNAVSVGTSDHYAAAGTANVHTEVTGIAVTAGLKTVEIIGATKNASSTGYQLQFKTVAYVRTGA